MNNDALDLLVEQIGNNLREFDVELDKLKLMAYPEKLVTKQMVEDISISNQDVFHITDLYIKNQKGKALLEFKKLTDKKFPLEILAVMQTVLKKWITIKNYPNYKVSNKGRVLSFKNDKINGELLEPRKVSAKLHKEEHND